MRDAVVVDNVSTMLAAGQTKIEHLYKVIPELLHAGQHREALVLATGMLAQLDALEEQAQLLTQLPTLEEG